MTFKGFLIELFGTAGLIFFGVLAAGYANSASAGLLAIALAHGIYIAIAATSAGPITGGQFNPAVSIGLFALGKMNATTLGKYIAAELIGGLVGSILVRICGGEAFSPGVPALGNSVTMLQGLVTEIIATGFLMLTILGVAVDPRAPRLGGLYIGLSIIVLILAVGPISGACMNPARWFGPAVAGGGFANAALYIVGPIVGALAAAFLYKFCWEPDALA